MAPLRGQVDGAPICAQGTVATRPLVFSNDRSWGSPAKGLAAPVDDHREEKEQWKVRHLRIMAACAVAACAICALAAANASAALPEWGKCVKLPATIKGKEKKAGTGKFANSNCTEATTGGEFEFLKGTSELPVTEFENKMTTPEAVLELSVGIQVRCTGQTAKGKISGTKEVSDVEVTFTGCKAPALNFACENKIVNESSEEHPDTFKYVEGEINTRRLKGKLGYISGKGTATPVVGLSLEPEEKHGLFAFFGCGTHESTNLAPLPLIFSSVGENPRGKGGGDSIISPISPVDKMGTETTQTYKEKTKENPETHEIEVEKGVQEPSAFENGKPDFLETQLILGETSLEWLKSAQEETAVTKLTSGEELEIKA
jgi:hypothetical protein